MTYFATFFSGYALSLLRLWLTTVLQASQTSLSDTFKSENEKPVAGSQSLKHRSSSASSALATWKPRGTLRWLLWSGLVLTSLPASSQRLTPRVIVQQDTLLCFTVDQSRDLLGRVTSGEYCDSLLSEYKGLVEQKDVLIAEKDNLVSNLEEQVEVCETSSKREVKKFRRQRNAFGIGAGILTILLLL